MKALVLVGPTASGKTELSINICVNYFQGIFEIISADSVQVYKCLDIGSGKVSKEIRENTPHHLVDEISPDKNFDAGEFCIRAEKICSEIYARGKLPFFVGGSGMYIDSFFFGLSKIPDFPPEIRERLKKDMDEKGLDVLYDELKCIDPVASERIHRNDRQRILRALQVYRGTGKPISWFWSSKIVRVSPETMFFGIDIPRNDLFSRIDARVDLMFQQGLVDEISKLRSLGITKSVSSMSSIGYSEVYDFLEGKISLSDAINSVKKSTRKLAKRQITWFKKNKKIDWIRPEINDTLVMKIKNWMRG